MLLLDGSDYCFVVEHSFNVSFCFGYLLLLVVREKCEVTKPFFRCQTGSLISSLDSASDALSDLVCVMSSCFVL